MAFGLGQSIAALFQNIANILAQGGQKFGPLPKGPPSQPQPQPQPPPYVPGSPIPIPEPPHTSEPLPTGPLPTIPTPSPPLIPPGTDTSNCPPLTLADRLKIYAASLVQSAAEEQPVSVLQPEVVSPVPALVTQANGTPIEAQDVFRFRALSTSNSVEVTFYGRVMLANGTIVPFARKLTTSVANTLYEVTMQGAKGYLLGSAASVPINAISAGTVNAIGEIGRVEGTTFTPHTLLFSGQLDDLTPLTDNSNAVSAPVSAPTFTFTTTAAFSGTSSDTVITPPSGRRIRFVNIHAEYDCSAVAGNRQLVIRLLNSGDICYEGLQGNFATANTKMVYRAAVEGQIITAAGSLPASFLECAIPLPSTLYFTTATTVLLSAYGQQAGDAFVIGTITTEIT